MTRLAYDAERKIYSYQSALRTNTGVITSMDAYEIIHPFFNFGIFKHQPERFFALYLDENWITLGLSKFSSRSNQLIEVDIQKLIDDAVGYKAAKVWIAHSSRTNKTSPTLQDDELTRLLLAECSKSNLEVIDHLIISEYGMYYSYTDNGRLMP